MKMKILKLLVLQIILLLSAFPAVSRAGNFSNKLSIGIGYPYVGIKYALTEKISAEARGAFEEGIYIYGARGYYNFTKSGKLTPFSGVELDYVVFDYDDIEGNGFIAYPFIGGEYYVLDNLSLKMDFGSAFISLQEDEFELKVDGFEWVVNLGVYYYLR